MDIDTFGNRLASLERRMSALDGTIQPQPGNPAARGAVAPGNPNPGGDGPVKASGEHVVLAAQMPSEEDIDRFRTRVVGMVDGIVEDAIGKIKEAAKESVQSITDALDAGIARIGEAVDKELGDLSAPAKTE